MTGTESSIDRRAGRPRRWLRYAWRSPLLLLHLLVALPLTAIVVNPLGQRIVWNKASLTEHMIRWWSGWLCTIFGLRVTRVGELVSGPVMLLANHVSWIDISVLHSQRAAGFVAKGEIARWPVVGWLARVAGTVFHTRGSDASREAANAALAERLQAGHSVALFPEGRTSDGTEVLRFHGRLLKAAVLANVPIQPVALAYQRAGSLVNHEMAFRPGEHFMGGVLRLLGDPPRRVNVICGKPIDPTGRGRRELAWAARENVVEALGELDVA